MRYLNIKEKENTFFSDGSKYLIFSSIILKILHFQITKDGNSVCTKDYYIKWTKMNSIKNMNDIW